MNGGPSRGGCFATQDGGRGVQRAREREREIEWAAVSMKGVLEESEINNGFSASSSGVKRKSRRLKVVWSEVFEAEPARHRNACCCLEGLC